jgi:hypothetical protein
MRRKIAELLRRAGWLIDKRVERIWRREGLKARPGASGST